MRFEPAVGSEVGHHAGGEQAEAEGDCPEDPARPDAAFDHQPIEQRQHKDEHRCLSKERATTMCGDGDQVDHT